MTSRRTTIKSGIRARPAALRDRASKFSSMENYRRALAADVHHLSAAQVGARLDAVEKKFQRATHSAAEIARCSMREAVAAGKVVRSSIRQAVAAVRRATRRVAKRVSVATRAATPARAAKPVRRASRSAGA